MKLVVLVGLRATSLGLMLAQNVLLVRFVPLDQIGVYYVIGTMAYLGNAMVFVGADLNLQQRLSDLSINRRINRSGLFRYVLATGVSGSLPVLACGGLYFYLTHLADWRTAALLCVCMSIGTYLGSLVRNLCQLAMLQTYSALGPIVEGAIRCAAIGCLAYFGRASAGSVAAASACASACAAAVLTSLLLSRCRHSDESYLDGLRSLIGKVMHVGGSGVANWSQLQGYRPVVATTTSGAQVVGTLSFMTTLGSTAASAVFTILALLQMPRQYSSRGATSRTYVKTVALAALALSALSIPAGLLFLKLSNRPELVGLVYLVALGVLLESGNAIVGICANHLNVLQRSMAILSRAGLVGCGLTFILLYMPPIRLEQHLQLALILAIGQACTVGLVVRATFFNGSGRVHAER